MSTQISPILGPNGQPYTRELTLAPPPRLPKTPSRLPQAVDFPTYDRYALHPGYGVENAKRINEALRLAELGYPWHQCDLFEDILERDGHLRGAVEGRIEAVAGKEWVIVPGGDAPEDIRVADLLEVALRKVENWNDTLQHQLIANFYGYSASEIVWERVDGIFVPTWFVNVPHRRFIFSLANDEPRLLTPEQLAWGEPLEKGKWLFSKRRHRITAMSGLMRTAVWWAVFKRWAIRDWLIFSQRYGLPYVTAAYQAGADDVTKAVAKQAIQDLGSDGGAILSDLITLTIHELQHGGGRANDVQGALADRCDMEISKLISGATLTSSTGGPGSFALGRVHADVRFELIEGDAHRLSERFDQDVARPFVTFNGFTCAAPKLKINVIREVDPMTRANVLAKLQGMGVELDEAQTRQEFQIKKPAEGKGLKPLAGAGGEDPKPEKNSGDAVI